MYIDNKTIDISQNVYLNKTRLYLVQQLQHYGMEFMEHIISNHISVYAIQDYGYNITTESKKLDSNVYLLFDVNGPKVVGNYINIDSNRIQFQESLLFFQNHKSYVTDYCFDSNKTGHLHVIVLKLPFPEKLEYFLKGQYSKMYTDAELQKWFQKEAISVEYVDGKKKQSTVIRPQWAVLKHDSSYFDTFKKNIRELFGNDIKDDSISLDHEFDVPPKLNKEILRYDVQ